jgi:hypothetical protein
VTSDTTLVPLLYSRRQRISLNDYITRSYPPSFEASLPSPRDGGVYTDGQEVAIAGQIIRANARFAQSILLRSGHQIELSDLKNHNLILLGSSYSNPWAQMFEDRLNFRLALSERPPGVFRGREMERYPCRANLVMRNPFPQPREESEYPCYDHNQSYAGIAFLPAEQGSGHVLLIAGTTAESTAAAGEFLLDERLLRPALKAAGIDPEGSPRYFEFLLRVTAFVGGATETGVVASRVHAPGKP